MDEYDKKFAEMQKYIPFLEAMIERLQKVKDKSREGQLQKMQSLHGILSNSKRKLKIETLQRCEEVLQKLHTKVEKGNAPGVNFPNKKSENNPLQTSSCPESAEEPEKSQWLERSIERSRKFEKSERLKDQGLRMDETPASPTPPATPDQVSLLDPIIIPTERREEFRNNKSDSKPASPDECEIIPTKLPIIIPTEREEDLDEPLSNFSSSIGRLESDVPEWDMLEESEEQSVSYGRGTWQPIIVTGHETTNTAMPAGNNLLHNVNPDNGRHHIVVKHIPTVPVPSLEGSRRLSSVLKRNRLNSVNSEHTDANVRSESPVNIQDTRRKPSDPDILFPTPKNVSPRIKDGSATVKMGPKSAVPLLVSPPPILTGPPLSMEDLAELLLGEEDDLSDKKDEQREEKDEQHKEKDEERKEKEEQRKGVWERLGEITKVKKDTRAVKQQSNACTSKKESNVSKSFVLTQEDIDRENERRWEEIDKHIVKCISRTYLPNIVPVSPMNAKVEALKVTDSKPATSTVQASPQICAPSSVTIVDKATDPRNRPPSPAYRERDVEPRYADNYERHPRVSRESYENDNSREVNIVPNPFSLAPGDELSNSYNYSEGSLIADDRITLYQRRSQLSNTLQQSVAPHDVSSVREDVECRRDNSNYFNRQMGNRTNLHNSPAIGDFCNQQWPSSVNYTGNVNPPPSSVPNPYQRTSNLHPTLWNLVPGSGPMESVNEPQHRPTQFSAPLGPVIHPLISPTIQPQDINRGLIIDGGFRDNIANNIVNNNTVPMLQPMMSPPNYAVGAQYRGFQSENRAYEASYDRSTEFSHVRQSWETNRTNESSFRRENEVVHNRTNTEVSTCRPGTPNPYGRPSTPCPWNRDRERSQQNRGREPYYETNIGETRVGFNRDCRRTDWERDTNINTNISANINISINTNTNTNTSTEWDNCNRFSRDARTGISNRDPRVRSEHRAQNPSQPKESTSIAIRDPRLAKDIQSTVTKPKDTVSNDRDPRRRNSESKEFNKLNKITSPSVTRKSKEKAKSHKSFEIKNRRNSDSDGKQTSASDKAGKDKMQSPLESLYGVIDTKAKVGRGYGLQKFKIPKIKRPDPPPLSKADLLVSEIQASGGDYIPSESWDLECDGVTVIEESSVDTQSKISVNVEQPMSERSTRIKGGACTEITNESGNRDVSSIVDSIMKNSDDLQSKQSDSKEHEGPKLKEEVTQEWIEALIRKSLEFGEGKKLFEQAKLLQKLGEALHAKKLKRIKRIIESDSESSSSDKDEVIEIKKVQVKKKRRVIMSDSSEEESLADRLDTLNMSLQKEKNKELTKDADNEQKQEEVDEVKEVVCQKDADRSLKIDSVNEDEKPLEIKCQDSSVSTTKKKRSYKKRGKSSAKKNASFMDEEEEEEEEGERKETETGGIKESEDKESAVKVRTKTRRRNSLEMLQEDIREMFISKGVITATGHRMCRLIKEGQSNLNMQTIPVTSVEMKKVESSNSPNKQNVETNFETDESDLVSSTVKTKSSKASDNEESTKSKSKASKKITKRSNRLLSKEFINSSDSEEDQPLSVRTENLSNEAPLHSEITDHSETQSKEESEEVLSLRRSKRVPRVVVEKTDLLKIDSSKIMFDSSSDESFGIDVSELAAAVDISLHPEQQESETSATPAATKKRSQISKKRNKNAKTKNLVQSIEEKADDTLSFTDDGSITSDVSASGKKMSKNSDKAQLDTNEELLSNILIGLVTQKSTKKERRRQPVDKESDVDGDEALDGTPPTEETTKKLFPRKKKKKLNWQMGILSKKKKKKSSSLTSLTHGALESEVSNANGKVDSSLDKSRVETNASLSMNKDIKEDGDNEGAAGENQDGSLKKSNPSESVSSSYRLDSQSNADDDDDDTTVPEELHSNASEMEKVERTNAKEQKVDEDKGNIDKDNVDSDKCRNNEVIREEGQGTLTVDELINHAWSKQDKYKCLLCFFSGKNIVYHYRQSHPGKEVLISRFNVAEAKRAIQEAKDNDFEKNCVDSLNDDDYEFICRCCHFSIQDTKNAAMEAFYEHCTTHTGEYRFKCVSCPYQSVARSSMRTHYYKVCRKLAETIAVAITEDKIPDENRIYGYICSTCNFVQLKKCNIEKHVQKWHSNDPNVEFFKINMSTNLQASTTVAVNVSSDETKEESKVSSSSNVENFKVKEDDLDEEQIEEQMDNKGIDDTVNEDIKTVEKLEELDECDVEKEKTRDFDSTNVEDQEEKVDVKYETDEKLKLQQDLEVDVKYETDGKLKLQDPEVPAVAGNLSAFVCPPELENKEVEIQLERKKRMQEIVENIGIKVNKDSSKRGLSIIDKLKDKMETNLQTEIDETEIAKDPLDTLNISSVDIESNSLKPEASQSDLDLNSSNLEPSQSNEDIDIPSEKDTELTAKINVLDCTDANVSTDNLRSSSSVDEAETKMKDPLTTVGDPLKRYGSETETSDYELITESALPYESDSSTDQSENELSTDVNTLLKETSNINASSNGLMMTTIQRLAAQLQNAKSFQASENEIPCDTQVNADKVPTKKVIPKAPNVIPISSIRRFFGRQDSKYQEYSQDLLNDSNQPKNFIRLRRLSGDMLSVPVQPMEYQSEAIPCSTGDKHANLAADILQPDTEKECSFLKIENVVSLAPKSDKVEEESTIISDIRKAVETSPVKNKGVSVLRKPSPLILKRISNRQALNQSVVKTAIQAVHPNTTETLKLIPIANLPTSSQSIPVNQVTTNFVPIVPKSKIAFHVDSKKLAFPVPISKTVITTTTPPSTRTITTVSNAVVSPKLNYKIVKVLKTTSLLKHKDNSGQTVAMKLKSADAYNLMLKLEKLCHLYKCMARECSYTTDLLSSFCHHYQEHANDIAKTKNLTASDGYQNCAYCSMVLADSMQMRQHLESKHAFCQYQCSYCFYRAVTQSYVEIHQEVSHPNLPIAVLLGTATKSIPTQDVVDRRECIQPFVCQHECGKYFYVPEAFVSHLKTKHGLMLSIFKCHMCSATSLKAEQLISHYKMHGIYKYQCLYCINGSDTIYELHNHLSNFHCNRLPNILERSLPSQVVKTKDVLEQLIVKNVDEGYKYSNLIINDTVEAESNRKLSEFENTNILDTNVVSTVFSKTSEDITVIDQEGSSKEINTIINSRAINNDGNSNHTVNTSEKIQLESTSFNGKISLSMEETLNKSSEQRTDLQYKKQSCQVVFSCNFNQETQQKSTEINCYKSLENNSDNYNTDHNSQHILQEPELVLKYINKDVQSAIDNAVDPLGFSDDVNPNDEFVSINLLDNPSFLKNVGNPPGCTLLTGTKTIKCQNKDDDSDIEIIEDIVPCTNKLDVKESDSHQERNIQGEEEPKNDTCSEQTENKQESVVRSNTEDANVSLDTDSSMQSAPKESKELLTLEDIKDTGFTGTDLYKCCYENCAFSASTSILLKTHVKTCDMRDDEKNIRCAHCKKRFLKSGFLFEHLKVHGLKRFGCSLCKMRCTMSYQAMAHMKTKHKYPNSKLVPADPKNPSADGLFVVQPLHSAVEKGKGKRRTSTKSNEKASDKNLTDGKVSFSPDEIESLPRQAIYNREIQCAVCPYTTKVRTNIIRHLQLHAKDESVPESGPVNPVPCLDKKERMFDKMVNLASSSHQNGRMGGKPKEPQKDNADDSLPKFIPEHKRYVCGVSECSYLTVDEAMLRYHLKALHSEEVFFRCPHCPSPLPGQESQNTVIDKMGVHLKMHDSRLYKCSHCNYHHYHRHVVERHLTDKHPEKRPFVRVIREPESTENTQSAIQDEAEDEVSDRDGNHWKCNMCDYKCIYKAEMVTHAATSHDEKSQFKCTLCTYKTSGKMIFEQHAVSKHPDEPNIVYSMVYEKLKGSIKKSTEMLEQVAQDEPFDTTPLWRRDMPRIRHIRGILLEEDAPASETPTKLGKRKSDNEIVTKPAKIKSSKSASLDGTKVPESKSRLSLSNEKKYIETEDDSQTRDTDKLQNVNDTSITEEHSSDTATELNTSEEFHELSDSDMGLFGPYGKPNGNMYVCTLCNHFKTKYKHDMRDHLYRELKYARWHCRECGYLSINRTTLLKHFMKQHPGEHPDHEPLTPDNAIEEWVGTLLKKQTDIMKGTTTKKNKIPSSNETTPSKISKPTVASSPASTEKSITQSTLSTPEKCTKTVDLADRITNLQDNSTDSVMLDAENFDDDDSGDNGDLVIDIKEDSIDEKETEEDKPDVDKSPSKNNQDKPLTCKHCNMKFARWRGFKLHVQLTHLKRLGFLCPYCDRSTNSESMMRQHINSKHPGCPEKIIHNPAAGGPELTNEFWEKEYGLVCPKSRPKKRKHKSSIDDSEKSNEDPERTDTQDVCNVCGFIAMNFTGLKAHMRIHATKNIFRCAYCTFSGSIKAEMWQHSELNHPHMSFKIEEIAIAGPSNQKVTVEQQQNKKPNVEDYSDDIEEEHVTPTSNVQQKLIYCCFYCTLRSSSLDTVKTHWRMMHKDPKSQTDSSKWKPGVPFRYKELYVSVPPPQQIFKCAYCQKRGIRPTLKLHIRRTHTNLPVRFVELPEDVKEEWICQWCSECCDSESKVKHHQNMFHSHLPVHFKKKEKEESQKGYNCPECSFTTIFLSTMRKHITKHIDVLKCKYCNTTFSSPARASAHHVQTHAELEFKVDSVKDYDSLVEKMMTKIMWTTSQRTAKNEIERGETSTLKVPKSQGVAKKSTTKSAVRVHPVPFKIKSVARKSTNPLPRYRPGVKFSTEEANEKVADSSSTAFKSEGATTCGGFSYYGVPKSSVDLTSLSTYMVVGGHRMKVNCTTLAQLININPRIIVKGLKNVKDNTTFTNRK